MFRVFNKIRQQLFTEKRLVAYLGYAFGEVVLIVVGILIALQINDWAESRKDRLFEQETLAQIRENLQADHATLDEILANRLDAVQSIDNVLAIEDPTDPDDDLKYWLADIMQFDRFNSITNAYEVLKSRGLDIVRNDELRLVLGVYYDSWARQILAENQDIESGFVDHWIPTIISDFETFDWDEMAKPYDESALLTNNLFRNTLRLQQDNHAGAAEHLEKMIRVNQRLQKLIDAELGRGGRTSASNCFPKEWGQNCPMIRSST